jgi:aldose 1-epimerase
LNNEKYKIEKFYLGENAMHGTVYDAMYEIAETQANEDFALVELLYQYKGEDKGYPFAYNIKLVWKLETKNKLSVTSTIQHSNSFAIPYCEGWHPYFKLDAPIDNCTLQFDATEMLDFDENLIPTGKLVNDDRFTNPTLLKNINLDNCFLLSNKKTRKAVLKGKQLILTITPDASYPYLQIFTPDHRENIAIENLSAAPDAFNNKMGLLMLEPNKEYHFTTSYEIQILRQTVLNNG